MKVTQSKLQRARRARKGDRSFQPSAAGKGDADRTDDVEAYRRNFDAINWGRTRATPTTPRGGKHLGFGLRSVGGGHLGFGLYEVD